MSIYYPVYLYPEEHEPRIVVQRHIYCYWNLYLPYKNYGKAQPMIPGGRTLGWRLNSFSKACGDALRNKTKVKAYKDLSIHVWIESEEFIVNDEHEMLMLVMLKS